MDIQLFKSYCDCVTGCIIGIIAFSCLMYMFVYVIRNCVLDSFFKDGNK